MEKLLCKKQILFSFLEKNHYNLCLLVFVWGPHMPMLKAYSWTCAQRKLLEGLRELYLCQGLNEFRPQANKYLVHYYLFGPHEDIVNNTNLTDWKIRIALYYNSFKKNVLKVYSRDHNFYLLLLYPPIFRNSTAFWSIILSPRPMREELFSLPI